MLYAYPYLSACDKASFAHYTLIHRVPLVLQRVMRDYPSVALPMSNLLREIQQNIPVQPFSSRWEDAQDWEPFFAAFGAYRWGDLPFFAMEAYLYRRIQEAGRKRMGEEWDPFARVKEADLLAQLPAMEATWKHALTLPKEDLVPFITWALNGNQADLSQMQLKEGPNAFGEVNTERILVDDRAEAISLLERTETQRVHYILDNSGAELFHDLLLIHALLEGDFVQEVHVHAKPLPTFVSDTTFQDRDRLLQALSESIPELYHDLVGWEQAGGLRWKAPWFWNQPYGFPLWPEGLRATWQANDFMITKGDANYRRILEDRKLPHEIPTSWVDYLPCPLLAMRTLKSEIQVGLRPGQADEARTLDPDWLTQGRWGIYQLFGGNR